MKKILLLGFAFILSFYSIESNSQSVDNVTITSPILCYGDYANINMLTRSSVQETYDFILNDLESAESGLSDSDNKAVATKALAQSLLAKTYLHMNDFVSAETYATQVIDNVNYSLNSSFLI